LFGNAHGVREAETMKKLPEVPIKMGKIVHNGTLRKYTLLLKNKFEYICIID